MVTKYPDIFSLLVSVMPDRREKIFVCRLESSDNVTDIFSLLVSVMADKREKIFVVAWYLIV